MPKGRQPNAIHPKQLLPIVQLITGRKRSRCIAHCTHCGRDFETWTSNVRQGQKSCGCIQKQSARQANTTHGMTYTLVHMKWRSMLKRCRDKSEKNYGARGITYDPAWADFNNFYRDMGDPPSPEHTLERLDPDGNYTKDNCKWATWKEQFRNLRKTIRLVYNGRVMPLQDWAETVGIQAGTIYHRLRLGWTVRDTLSLPPSAAKYYRRIANS